MSNMLEQAIVDAAALREAALKNAEETVINKFSSKIKEAVDNLLELEDDELDLGGEDELGMDVGGMDDMGMDAGGLDDMGGGMESDIAVDVPLAAVDGEQVCPCADEDEEIEIDFGELERQIAGEDELGMEVGTSADMLDREGLATELDDENELPLAEGDEVEEGDEVDEARTTNLPVFDQSGNLTTVVKTKKKPKKKSKSGSKITSVSFDDDGKRRTKVVKEADEVDEDLEETFQKVPTEGDPVVVSDDGGDMDEGCNEGCEDKKDLEETDQSDEDEARPDAPKPGPSTPMYETEEVKEEDDVELDEKNLEQLAEELEVDYEPVPTGYSGANKVDKRNAEELAAVAMEDEETAEEIVSLGKAIEDLKETNKKLSADKKNITLRNKKLKEALLKLKNKLEETALVNARLFYKNQVLSDGSLNERQKGNLAENINKACSVEEAKTIYETLKNAVGSRRSIAPKSLNEVVASRITSQVVSSKRGASDDPAKNRMKILAGIKKRK